MEEEKAKKGLFGRVADRARAEVQERRETSAEAARRAAELRHELVQAGELWEYTVVSVRESLVGDKIKTEPLQRLLNQYAAQGWRLKTVTSADVAGRVGPGGVSGLVLVFERRARA